MKQVLPPIQLTPTKNSPSRFGCTNPEEASGFHLTLCGDSRAHNRARPEDLDQLWDWYNTEVDTMLTIEATEPVDREAWAHHDTRASLIWRKIEEVSRQINQPTYTPTNWMSAVIARRKVDFAAIKDRIDLVAYIQQFTELKPAGRTYKGKCPLPGHQDDSPSLTVYPDSKSWWCFGCQQGSDIFDFAKKMHGGNAKELARI